MNKENIFRILCGGLAILIFGYIFYKVFTEDSGKLGAVPSCYENSTQIRPSLLVTKQDIANTIVTLNNDTALNSAIGGIFNKIDTMQIIYFTKYGTYWNGWKTHSEPVEYGTTKTPNNWDCEKERYTTWGKETNGTISIPLPAQFQISVLTKSNGTQEYVLNAAVQKNGAQYNKAKINGKVTQWEAYPYD